MTAGVLSRTLWRVHFVLAAVFGGVAFVVISGLALVYVAVRRGRGEPAVVMARCFHYTMTFLLGWKITVENRERLIRKGPCVYMLGHQSNLDIVIHGGIYPVRTVVIGKREVAKVPVFGWFFVATKNILLDRGNLTRAIESIRLAAERMRREQISVWVFPEGHRNTEPDLLPFKKGAFHLAIAAQVPIVPIVAEPVNTVMNARRWMVRRGRLRINVLPEIPSEGLGEADVDQLIENVRGQMQEAQNRYLAEARPKIS